MVDYPLCRIRSTANESHNSPRELDLTIQVNNSVRVNFKTQPFSIMIVRMFSDEHIAGTVNPSMQTVTAIGVIGPVWRNNLCAYGARPLKAFV